MRAVRAQERAIGLIRKIPVGDKAPLPGEQAPVFQSSLHVGEENTRTAGAHGWQGAQICAKKAAVNAHRFKNRIAAWLALVGIALNASWPLLANAGPRVPALPSEICSATGQKHGGESPVSKGARPSHCTLCPYNAERG